MDIHYRRATGSRKIDIAMNNHAAKEKDEYDSLLIAGNGASPCFTSNSIAVGRGSNAKVIPWAAL